eukprot:3693934-Pyramimonas_sp.AAC.1
MLSPVAISPFHRPQLIQRYKEKTGDQSEMPNATIAEIRLHIIKGLVASGGIVKIGGPPRGALERAVQAAAANELVNCSEISRDRGDEAKRRLPMIATPSRA